MKKLLNFLLLISSFFGYLEWPPDNHGFIFELEADLFRIASNNIMSVAHPFILLPFAGQLLLLITLFQSPPRRWLTVTGMLCTGILLLLFLLVGLLKANIWMVASTLPFILISFFVLKFHFQRKSRFL
jgi:hypothetical protein